jgi:hypothetical protein
MSGGEFWELGHIADRELESELARLLGSGSRTEARILAHLAAVEERVCISRQRAGKTRRLRSSTKHRLAPVYFTDERNVAVTSQTPRSSRSRRGMVSAVRS